MGKTRIVSQSEKDKIIYNYTILNYGQKKAGKEFGISDKIVKKILKEANIHIRTIQETNKSRYYINENYFKTQSANMAYILGMLGSDGYVSGVENHVYIELQRCDKEILVKINNELENEREVKDYETSREYKNSKLYFYSREIKNDLAKYNIIPNKTYSPNYLFPSLLEEQYLKHYIRGMFDGDGCIKKATSITWQIDSSSLDVITNIKNYLSREGIETAITTSRKKNIQIYRVYCYGNQKCKKIYELFYPAELFMSRKKNKFEELLMI